jgi:hypothetical protein
MTGNTFEALLGPNLQLVRRFVQTRLRVQTTRTTLCNRPCSTPSPTAISCARARNSRVGSARFAMNEVRMFFRTDRAVLSLAECPHIDSGPSPLARVEQMERLEWLKAGVDKLSDRDRATIRLRDFEGLSLTETAEVFKSSSAATKFRPLSRAETAGGRRPQRSRRPQSRTAPGIGCCPDIAGQPMSNDSGQAYRVACLERRGGNHWATYSAVLSGLAAWVSCNPLRPYRRGDLYYLSACRTAEFAIASARTRWELTSFIAGFERPGTMICASLVQALRALGKYQSVLESSSSAAGDY